MLKTEDVSLVHTREGKWNTVTISTGTMINAGSYRVVITTKNAEGLVLSGIDVQ